MKKLTLFIAFLLCSSAGLIAQSNALVYLKNGSQIRGQVQTLPEVERIHITLDDGTVIELDEGQVEYVDNKPKLFHVFQDGRRILTKGTYTSVGVNYLTAKRPIDWRSGRRWNVGGHFSVGHQFSQRLGVGAGIGVDLHEQVFMPVFGEVQGRLFSPDLHSKTMVLPVTYGLQVGYNLPVQEWVKDDNEFEKITGGWLIYPSIGLAFPSRQGHAFRVDLGYKFQRYSRKSDGGDWWDDYRQTDVVTLKSLALRAGWVF